MKMRPLRSRQAQSGIEFLAVTGIGMLLLLGVSFFLLADSKTSKDRAQLQQVQQLGGELIQQARIVQAQGRNSWVTVEAQLPENLAAIYTVENNTIVFEMNTINGVVSQPVFSSVPVQGWYVVGKRAYVYNITTTQLSGGVKRFIVTSNSSAVIIAAQ